MKATTTTPEALAAAQPRTIADESAQVGMGVLVTFGALCGAWGAACFISALAQHGISRMVMGWCKAVLGG